VLLSQGKLDEALKLNRDALAIHERLSAADPGNADRQRDLTIVYDHLADVLADQGKLDAALKVVRQSAAIREKLVAAEPDRLLWRSKRSVILSGALCAMERMTFLFAI
jgi:tetratricopeptide (TPR) repeat protein